MSLNLLKENRLYKKLFDLKAPRRDGLVLNVHHTDANSHKIRFVNGCFSKSGQVLVLADKQGSIFVVDFKSNKFWNLPKVTTLCTALKFSDFKENEILVGAHGGPVVVLDVETGVASASLMGHKFSVIIISFSGSSLCLTASKSEAIVWDLGTNAKLHVLHLQHSCTLKYISFMPVTGNILACFNDDFIQIWQFGTFQIKTELPPLIWYNHEIRSIAFTLDGKIMVFGCRAPCLALFLISNFKLLKFITLPENIQSIKTIDFLPQISDGGSNKILAILSGRGSISFYDIEQNILISELTASYEISKFIHSDSLIACILCSGDVTIYDTTSYTAPPIKTKPIRAQELNKTVKLKRCLEKIGLIKEQIREILEIEKLRLILKEWGEYPDAYRVKIWEHLLELPNNKDQYNAIINNRMIISFEDLCQKYPLENKRLLKNLKQLLDNLVSWSPFFFHVDYLPLFVFPFVKVFHNKPVACFEAVCTVIVNWCQFWFEYFPLPPVNVLAMVENVLLQHDPELLDFFTKNKITASLYAWPILKTAFSENLTAKAWKRFWDHVLTNEPSFLLCAVVAYNILQRAAILKLTGTDQFECFFNTHHPVDVAKLLAKTYHILTETNEAIHPRQYLNMFQRVHPGEYPNFCDYPKTAIDFKSKKEDDLKSELKHLKSDEVDLFRQRLARLNELETCGIEEEENRRAAEVEEAIRKQLLEEQEHVQNYYERLAGLRQKFREENMALAALKNKIAKKQQARSRVKHLSVKLDDVTFDKRQKTHAMTKIEDELLYHYSELLKNKYKIEQLLGEDQVLTSTRLDASSVFQKQQEELEKEIDFVRGNGNSEEHLKMLNLATGVAAMDALIKKVEIEIEKEKHGAVDESTANKKVVELQAETKELVSEVNKLLELLVDLRNTELGG